MHEILMIGSELLIVSAVPSYDLSTATTPSLFVAYLFVIEEIFYEHDWCRAWQPPSYSVRPR